MADQNSDDIDLHIDEDKWEAWEKAKSDYEDNPDSVDTSGSGRPDDGSAPDEGSPLATGDEDPDQPVGKTDEPVELEAVHEVVEEAEGRDEPDERSTED